MVITIGIRISVSELLQVFLEQKYVVCGIKADATVGQRGQEVCLALVIRVLLLRLLLRLPLPVYAPALVVQLQFGLHVVQHVDALHAIYV